MWLSSPVPLWLSHPGADGMNEEQGIVPMPSWGVVGAKYTRRESVTPRAPKLDTKELSFLSGKFYKGHLFFSSV